MPMEARDIENLIRATRQFAELSEATMKAAAAAMVKNRSSRADANGFGVHVDVGGSVSGHIAAANPAWSGGARQRSYVCCITSATTKEPTMSTVDVRCRVEPELKEEAPAVFKASGLDVSTPIRLFLAYQPGVRTHD
mgnify:CR=1 FL=1